MSLDSALSVASWGLRATQASIRIVSENVAGAQTPGYTAKTLPRISVVAEGALSGVKTGEVTRNVDRFLQDETWTQLGRLEALDMRERMLEEVEAAHGDPALGDSLGGLVGRLADNFVSLAIDPSDASRQAEIVNTAELLASRIAGINDVVTAARQETQNALRESVDLLNADLRELAGFNDQIRKIVASGRSAVSLEDQRDVVMTRIAGLTGSAFLRQPDGTMQPVAPGGLVLPAYENEGDVFSLDDATLAAASFYGTGGSVPALILTLPGSPTIQRDVTTRLTGGSMGALLELRDETLPLHQAELDELAHKLARRFEQQGLTLFTDLSGSVPNENDPALAPGDPAQTNYLGFASTIQVSDTVRADPRLVRDGTHAVPGTLVGATGSAFTPNPVGGPEGFTTLVDRINEFTFGREIESGVAHDPGFVTSGLGGAGTLSSRNGDPGTLGTYAARLTAEAGDLRRIAADAKAGVQASYELVANRLADESEVSIDREMALLVELQNSYGANARVISTVQAMWDALLASVR